MNLDWRSVTVALGLAVWALACVAFFALAINAAF
jgi:hypothetical protein